MNPMFAQQQILEQQLLQAAEVMEEQIDAEMKKMDEMDDDDIEKIRQRRIKAMQKAHQAKQEYLHKGHGTYKELPSEKDFFDEVKNSMRAVVHFYRPTTERCKIFDKHLEAISAKYLEARFVKLNAEKSPFLCERLKIKVIPTLLLIVDGKTQEKIVGFDQLGGHDDFSQEMLEWRLGISKVINYKGDLSTPPVDARTKKATSILHKKHGIRQQVADVDTDEELFGDD
jgi:thiol-disulfide isomerase/thioredoxin